MKSFIDPSEYRGLQRLFLLLLLPVAFLTESESVRAQSSDKPQEKFKLRVTRAWTDGQPRFEGSTNLPDGEELKIAVSSASEDNVAIAHARVEGTRFVTQQSTVFGEPIKSGRYLVKITALDQNPSEPLYTKSLVIESEGGAGKAVSADKSAKADAEPDASEIPTGDADKVRQMVVQLQLSGQLRLDCKAGKAWIDPDLWQAGDAEVKENFARTIFEGCVSVGGSHNLDVYDSQSAKRLATYNKETGFRAS